MPGQFEIPDWMIIIAQDITPDIRIGDVTIPEEWVFVFGLFLIVGVIAGWVEASRRRMAREARRHRDEG